MIQLYVLRNPNVQVYKSCGAQMVIDIPIPEQTYLDLMLHMHPNNLEVDISSNITSHLSQVNQCWSSTVVPDIHQNPRFLVPKPRELVCVFHWLHTKSQMVPNLRTIDMKRLAQRSLADWDKNLLLIADRLWVRYNSWLDWYTVKTFVFSHPGVQHVSL